jgi:hypothetical protein
MLLTCHLVFGQNILDVCNKYNEQCFNVSISNTNTLRTTLRVTQIPIVNFGNEEKKQVSRRYFK